MAAGADDGRDAPTVGLIGTFDIANYGDLLLPDITERELVARIPDLEVRRLAPFGWEHPVPSDGGVVAEPLGPPTRQRRAELAEQCDALVIGGGEIVHFEDRLLAPHYDTTEEAVLARAPSTWFVDGTGPAAPLRTVWNAVGIPFDIPAEREGFVRSAVERHEYVAVRDHTSCERLEKIGLEREVHVVPDPGFVAPRVFAADLLDRRRRLHATLGWLPPGPYLVVQGNGSMVDGAGRMSMAIDAVLGERPDLGIVLLETGLGHGDREFSAAFRAAHPARLWHPTAPLLPVDVAALIAGSHAFVGVSMHGAITAIAYGKRAVVFNAPRQTKLRGMVDHLGDRAGYAEVANELPAALRAALGSIGPDPELASITRRIDAHFDRLAATIERAHALRGETTDADVGPRVARLTAEVAAVRAAHAVRGRRLLAERDALTTMVDERDRHIAELASAIAEGDADRRERDALAAGLDERDRRIAELEATLEGAEADRLALDAARAEIEAIHATKTMRWLRIPRRIYGRLRR